MRSGFEVSFASRRRNGLLSLGSAASLLGVLSALLAVCAAQGAGRKIEARSEALQAVADSNLAFAQSIYKVLSTDEGNIFFSPVSIQVILALTLMGARGTTATQMTRGLQLPTDVEITKQGFKDLIAATKGDQNLTLRTANKIYTDARIALKPAFKATAQAHFASEVASVDFATQADATRVEINQWVEKTTSGKIKDLFAPGTLDAYTAVVLVNAIYFKADWALKFDPTLTRTEPFHATPARSVDVQMMHLNDELAFADNNELDCQLLELPYKGESVSLVVLLPNDPVDGLKNLEAKLEHANLTSMLDDLRYRNVDLSLPKFQLEQTFELNDVLKQLGMVDMFDKSKANFTGMTDAQVKVSKVVHKAFIEVNEQGAEAAAATGVVVSLESYQPPAVFIANRPFVFFLKSRDTNSLLFVGRFSNPPSQ